MKKVFFLIMIILCGINPFFLNGDDAFIGFGEIKEKVWGGVGHDWPFIYSMREVVKVRGPAGMLGIRLADNVPEVNEKTELLLHLDRVKFGKIIVDGSSYNLQFADVYPSEKIKVMGNGACIFQHIGSKIELNPRKIALLYPGKKLKSFTISFYLYPTMIFDGESVISMEAPAVEYNNKLAGFNLIFEDNRLKWNFFNIFSDKNGRFKDISISELEPSSIYEWHHHLLHYDADTGLMSLYVDGKESAVKWVTDNGTENGTILNGKLPESLTAPLVIGGSFVGYMDEIIISRGRGSIANGKYRNRGELISDILQLNSKFVNIAKIKWDSIEKKGTAVRIMYRISDNYFLPGNSDLQNNLRLRNEPEWKMVKNGEIIKAVGRYFQWKAILYGTSNNYTPILKNLRLFYEEDLPPSKPILLSAVPGNGSVTLKWVANKEEDIAGYRIYYGDNSHNYFGRGANLGDSPITLGNVTTVKLQGLTNEKVYFFSITAVDKSGQESEFSKELVTRPSMIYSNNE